MAETPTVTGRIDVILRNIAAEVDDLPRRAHDWDNQPVVLQTDYLLEWEYIADRLTEIDELYRAGRLTVAQGEAYRSLLARLRSHSDLVAKMDLDVPDGLLSDSAA